MGRKEMQEDPDAGVPRIVQSLFNSPGGERFYRFVMNLSRYIMVKVMHCDHGNIVSIPTFPIKTVHNKSFTRVVSKAMHAHFIVLKKRFLEFTQYAVEVEHHWKEFAMESTKEYRSLVKRKRDLEHQILQLDGVIGHVQQGTNTGIQEEEDRNTSLEKSKKHCGSKGSKDLSLKPRNILADQIADAVATAKTTSSSLSSLATSSHLRSPKAQALVDPVGALGSDNGVPYLKAVSENVFKDPLPQAVRSLWDNVKFYSNELKWINYKSVYGKVWLTALWSKGKATDHEKDGLLAENQRLKETIVDMQKQVTEQREMRLSAEKRLNALQTDMDKKKEKEQEEMLGKLNSAVKEEIATLKSKKQVAEQSEKLLKADKRLAELEANLNTKRETENKEMVKQLKSIMKEEIDTLKSKDFCEKKTSHSGEEMKELKSQIDETKVQRNFYLRQTTDLSYFTMNLQRSDGMKAMK